MLLGRNTIKRIPWAQLFVEAVLVVLSVLLALALNNWREDRIHKNLAEQALRSINNEIRANKIEVEETLSHHKMLIDTLQGDNPARGIALKLALIEDNAWETAQATQAVIYLDYDIVQQVSKIHELQEMYQRITNSVAESLYMNSNTDRKQARLLILYDLQALEQLILQAYDNFLAMLEP